MSVCIFGIEELANLGACILDAPGKPNDAGTIKRVCEELALVSQANVACFNDRYANQGACATAHDFAEIGFAIAGHPYAPGNAPALTQALSTARLLHYNCVDDGGDFTLKIEGAHAALISILEGLAIALARKAGLNP